MRKEEKSTIISDIKASLEEYAHFYLTNIEALDALESSQLRRKCFKADIKLVVVKNTLLKRALEELDGDYSELYPTLVGNTAVMLCNTGNAPAKLIKSLRKDKWEKPILKSAYIDEAIYIGDDQIDFLSTIKSKEELIGDVITLLQSPAKNVISALQSGNGTIHGLLQAIGEKNN
jgi:large subunit ribosomal protein L10